MAVAARRALQPLLGGATVDCGRPASGKLGARAARFPGGRRVPVGLVLDPDDARALAHEVLIVSLEKFRTRSLTTWDPARGASLTSNFVGRCLYDLPHAFAVWDRRERQPLPVDRCIDDGRFGPNPDEEAEARVLVDDAEVLQVLGRAGYRPPERESGGRTAGPRPLLELATELWTARTPGARRAGPRPQPELSTELWTAIGGGGMDICFQPKVEMVTGIVRGAEALVRWDHPRLGRVRPAKLVRFAERIGAIRPLTMWVLQEALTACRAWRDHGWDLGVAVNLPASMLVDRRLTSSRSRSPRPWWSASPRGRPRPCRT